MEEVLLAFIIGIGLSIITVVGDFFVKKASIESSAAGMQMLLLGAFIYGLTAFGWVWVMKKIKLSTLGVLYAVSCVILLTLVSIFYFKEKINPVEIFGIVLALISLIILYRFA